MCVGCGLLTGFRLDLVLALPGLILWSVYLLYRGRNAKHAPACSVFALFYDAGIFHLPVSVGTFQHTSFAELEPSETFQRLYGSITRKTHGGTLDLLATNYEAGALF